MFFKPGGDCPGRGIEIPLILRSLTSRIMLHDCQIDPSTILLLYAHHHTFLTENVVDFIEWDFVAWNM
jgi:hypothetical protein